jgi:anti-sigma factor RsiW
LGRHLSDDQLVEASLDGGSAPHLDTCGDCAVRYAALADAMERLRADAASEADGVFTAERLAAQQSQIMRRLEAAERPTRIIAFPIMGRPASGGPPRMQRWLAGAAAAGLLIGLVAGKAFDFEIKTWRAPAAGPQVAGGGRVAVLSNVSLSDEAFLTDLEAALSSPIPVLSALDEYTPSIRDPR